MNNLILLLIFTFIITVHFYVLITVKEKSTQNYITVGLITFYSVLYFFILNTKN